MDESLFEHDPLWKMARDFGRLLIQLENGESGWNLTGAAYSLLRAVTEVRIAENVLQAQQLRGKTLELCRQTESLLAQYFSEKMLALEDQQAAFFQLEQLRETIFLDLQEDTALCRNSA